MTSISKIALGLLALIVLLALPGPAPLAKAQPAVCGAGPVPASLIEQITSQRWAAWIRLLSGEDPVFVGGQQAILATRYSAALFWGGAPVPSLAYDYVHQQVLQWYPAGHVSEQSFSIVGNPTFTAKNLILELPGVAIPDEIMVLSAHLDSYSMDPLHLAPGAEDNASGSAALLEAARLFRHYRFERTLQLVWFTGEEQGLWGSAFYTHNLPPGRTIVGDINLDMFGYDSDDDHCFELHVGNLPASATIGQCFTSTIQANNLDLTYDYLTTQAEGYSDHESFWDASLGAVEVLENYSNQGLVGGCVGLDRNPAYHTVNDTIDRINLTSGTEITRAALASTANLAGPIEICLGGDSPELGVDRTGAQAYLTWTALPGASSYRIWRSAQGCSTGWTPVGEITGQGGLSLTDNLPDPAASYVYQVEAMATGGCVSLPSACTIARWPNSAFLPFAAR